MNELQRPQVKTLKVSLEDLLSLKRAERPPAEFWVEFEKQMRAKQLAAIVRKDPWWRSWRTLVIGTSRLRVPLGATAVLALTFMAAKEYRHRSPTLSKPSTMAAAVAAPVGAPTSMASSPEITSHSVAYAADETESLSSTPVSVSATKTPTQERSDSSTTSQSASMVAVSDDPSPGREGDGAPELIGFSAGPSSSNKSSLQSARVIAANLAVTEADQPELVNTWGRARTFEAVSQDRSVSVEPLAQVSTPRDARRARLLASLVPTDMHAPEHTAARSRERITSQLNDQSLSDSITRLGVGGNSLSIKF